MQQEKDILREMEFAVSINRLYIITSQIFCEIN